MNVGYVVEPMERAGGPLLALEGTMRSRRRTFPIGAIPVLHAPTGAQGPSPGTSFYVRDLDNNLIELMTYEDSKA
jgi:hypothetical protein